MKKLIARMKSYGQAVLFQAFVPLVPPTQSSKLADLYGSSDLSSFVNGLFKFAIAIGAIGAVLRIAYAGYLYMGSDLWSNKGKAKEVIGDVTLGLLLLLSIYLILYQINPNILKLNALKNIQPVQTTAPARGGSGQFTTQPAQNSFFGGTGGSYDPSLNGAGVSGSGNPQDAIDTGANPAGY